MATVGNLCTTIIGDLRRNDTSLSDIVLIDIKSAVRDYEAKRFYFNEKLMAVTLSATIGYSLAAFSTTGLVADIIEVDMVSVVNSGRTYQLEEKSTMDWEQISTFFPDIGNPQYYQVYGQNFYVYPASLAVGAVAYMYAHVKFAELSAMSDSNVWTNDASELIRNAALKRLWGRRFRDYDAAQACGIAEQDALKALQRRTEALAGTTVSGYL